VRGEKGAALKLDEQLLGRLQEAMRTDPELAVVGKFFTCDLLLGSGDRRFLLRFREGEMTEIVPDPSPVDPWRIAIKAPEGTWEKFLQDPPPPEFHDIWAATWLGHMMLEGDTKVLMQHHLAIWRTLKLLRETAARTTATV
jgi:hypothetical protein